jgi:hypothetical protein
MHTAQENHRVELREDLPELGLSRGDRGTVCSTWSVAGTSYEVEFVRDEQPIRVLLLRAQVEVEGPA